MNSWFILSGYRSGFKKVLFTSELQRGQLWHIWDIGMRAKSCPTLATPWTVARPGSSVHGILQARVLEWVAISSSRGCSRPRDRTCVCCFGRHILYHWPTWGALWGVRDCFSSACYSMMLRLLTATSSCRKPLSSVPHCFVYRWFPRNW